MSSKALGYIHALSKTTGFECKIAQILVTKGVFPGKEGKLTHYLHADGDRKAQRGQAEAKEFLCSSQASEVKKARKLQLLRSRLPGPVWESAEGNVCAVHPARELPVALADSTRIMKPFFSHGLLLLAVLYCLLPRTKTDYQEELDNKPDTDILHCQRENFQCQKKRFRCRKVAMTISNVSISLFKEMAQWSKDGNILFSPIRVVAAISMLALGAKDNNRQHILEGLSLNKTGLTEAEIHKCFWYLLHSVKPRTAQAQIRSGSSIFIDKGLNKVEKFVKGSKDLYYSDVVPIDLTDNSAAKTQIINYMRKETNKEIVDAVKSLEIDTLLALVNYIDFNGKAMFYFILPDEGKMHMAEERLSYPHFRRMKQYNSLRMVNAHIPELSISETHDLESVLNVLGINYVFNSEASSSEDDTLHKSFKVISTATLTFNDKGIEPVPNYCDNEEWASISVFQLNRPFLIFIEHMANGAPLFLGRVVNPKN
ncbi:alpha-1-antitrypsin 1-6-like [Meriones unguiculatus]|uniref:alpha-1-antitrypsin 1-6-like n=1 Tax=Meriones unguiculatus TaxID=10047 RepID=UPI000B4ED9B2|nr:alpha-1-antitrypsin 1-6-like [Meriones unguiculatus]